MAQARVYAAIHAAVHIACNPLTLPATATVIKDALDRLTGGAGNNPGQGTMAKLLDCAIRGQVPATVNPRENRDERAAATIVWRCLEAYLLPDPQYPQALRLPPIDPDNKLHGEFLKNQAPRLVKDLVATVILWVDRPRLAVHKLRPNQRDQLDLAQPAGGWRRFLYWNEMLSLDQRVENAPMPALIDSCILFEEVDVVRALVGAVADEDVRRRLLRKFHLKHDRHGLADVGITYLTEFARGGGGGDEGGLGAFIKLVFIGESGGGRYRKRIQGGEIQICRTFFTNGFRFGVQVYNLAETRRDFPTVPVGSHVSTKKPRPLVDMDRWNDDQLEEHLAEADDLAAPRNIVPEDGHVYSIPLSPAWLRGAGGGTTVPVLADGVGVDLGLRFAIGAVALDRVGPNLNPNLPDSSRLRSLTITNVSLHEPSRKHQLFLAMIKARTVVDLHFFQSLLHFPLRPHRLTGEELHRLFRSDITPLQIRQEPDRFKTIADLEASLSSPRNPANFARFVRTRFGVEGQVLAIFYNQHLVKRDREYALRAQRSALDTAASSIFKMIGVAEHGGRLGGGGRKPFIALGDLETSDQPTYKGRATMAGALAMTIRRKAWFLGVPVLQVNEFRTTSKTPCCGADSVFVDSRPGARSNTRVKGCPCCGRFWHRDLMSAETILKLAYVRLAGLPRPDVWKGRFNPRVGQRGYSSGCVFPGSRWVRFDGLDDASPEMRGVALAELRRRERQEGEEEEGRRAFWDAVGDVEWWGQVLGHWVEG